MDFELITVRPDVTQPPSSAICACAARSPRTPTSCLSPINNRLRGLPLSPCCCTKPGTPGERRAEKDPVTFDRRRQRNRRPRLRAGRPGLRRRGGCRGQADRTALTVAEVDLVYEERHRPAAAWGGSARRGRRVRPVSGGPRPAGPGSPSTSARLRGIAGNRPVRAHPSPSWWLAAPMPIVAGIGNTGNQTITMIVRALALQHPDRQRLLPAVARAGGP